MNAHALDRADGGVAADRGQVAKVAVAEARRRLRPREARADDGRGVPAHLHGGRGDAGHRPAVRAREVAGDEHLRVAGQRQVGRDRHAAARGPAARPSERRQRRAATPGGPDDRARRDALRARRSTPVASTPVTCASGVHLHAEVLELAARRACRAAPADSAGSTRPPPRPGATRARRRVDAAEVVAQRVARDLGERAGQLDAGRPAADDDERQPGRRASASALALGRLERAQDAPPELQRVLDRLQPGRVRGPLVVAEVGVRRAAGEHEVVVGRACVPSGRAHVTARGGVDRRRPRPARTRDVALPAQDVAQRRGDVAGAEQPAVATWYSSGWNRWWLRRSTQGDPTGARPARARPTGRRSRRRPRRTR